MVPAPPADTTAVPPPPVAPAPPPAAAPEAPPEAEVTEPAEPPAPRHRKPKSEPHKPVAEEVDPAAFSWRHGVLVVPFVGFHAVEGIAADDYDAGARFGFLLGAHATQTVSLNVELAMDLLQPKVDTSMNRGASVSGRDFTIAFSPLFHARSGIGEFVVGPKLGFWSSGIELTNPGNSPDQVSQAGWAFGFNLGAFAGVGDTAAIGALVSYQMAFLSQTCSRGPDVAVPGCDGTGFVPQILSFNLAAMF